MLPTRAFSYYHGLGCSRDPAAAAVLYRSAADSKNVEAMVSHALHVCVHRRLPANGVRLFQVALGMLHHTGDVGVLQDHALAMKWFVWSRTGVVSDLLHHTRVQV